RTTSAHERRSSAKRESWSVLRPRIAPLAAKTSTWPVGPPIAKPCGTSAAPATLKPSDLASPSMARVRSRRSGGGKRATIPVLGRSTLARRSTAEKSTVILRAPSAVAVGGPEGPAGHGIGGFGFAQPLVVGRRGRGFGAQVGPFHAAAFDDLVGFGPGLAHRHVDAEQER